MSRGNFDFLVAVSKGNSVTPESRRARRVLCLQSTEGKQVIEHAHKSMAWSCGQLAALGPTLSCGGLPNPSERKCKETRANITYRMVRCRNEDKAESVLLCQRHFTRVVNSIASFPINFFVTYFIHPQLARLTLDMCKVLDYGPACVNKEALWAGRSGSQLQDFFFNLNFWTLQLY